MSIFAWTNGFQNLITLFITYLLTGRQKHRNRLGVKYLDVIFECLLDAYRHVPEHTMVYKTMYHGTNNWNIKTMV